MFKKTGFDVATYENFWETRENIDVITLIFPSIFQ